MNEECLPNDALSPAEVRNALVDESEWTDAYPIKVLKYLHQHARMHPVGAWPTLERELFGDPQQYVQEDSDQGPGMFASMMDGPLTHFQTFSGLTLSDEASDALEDRPWQSLTYDVTDNLYETGDFDDYPGASDVFYWLVITDAKEFARSLREAIVEVCRRSGADNIR